MTLRYVKNCTGGGDINKPPETSKLSKIISRIIFFILLLGFFGVSSYVFFFSGYLKINSISISGNHELSSSDMQQSFSEYLQGNFLGIIPKNNFLFISQKKSEDFLENKFKKIRSATVSKKFPDTVSINIDERKAVLVWCSGENCFLVDENGVAYNIADFNSQEITQNHLLRINNRSQQDVSIGEKIIDSDYEQYVMGIENAFINIDQKISENEDAYSAPSNVANEIDVKTNKDIQIYFSTDFSLGSAVKSLKVVLEKEIPEDRLESVEYIDLRSEGKVFYKFKEKETEDSENSEKQDQ